MTIRSRVTMTGGRIIPHFRPSEFNQLDRDHGAAAYYWRANLCPCHGARSAAPKLYCPRCNGFGRYWTDKTPLLAVDTSDNSKLMFEIFGTWQPGDLSLNMPTAVDGTRLVAGEYDRFYFPSRIEHLFEAKTKGETRPDMSTAERLYTPACAAVLSCATVSADFVLGTNFNLIADENGNGTIISWIPGALQPAEGEDYAIDYEAAVFYHVREVKYRTEHNNRMPQLLRLSKQWSPATLTAIGAEGATGQGAVA